MYYSSELSLWVTSFGVFKIGYLWVNWVFVTFPSEPLSLAKSVKLDEAYKLGIVAEFIFVHELGDACV